MSHIPESADEVATVPIIERAARYARAGMAVFPVLADTKEPPHGYRWLQRATSKVSEVIEDFTFAVQDHGEEHISIGWAVGRDGYVATDLDVTEAPDWFDPIIATGLVNPTRRGRHFIHLMPDPEHPVGNGLSRFPSRGWGEVRGAGGYIIIAGPDRPGFDETTLTNAKPFPRPDWLTEAGDSVTVVSAAEVVQFMRDHNVRHRGGALESVRERLDATTTNRHETAVEVACWIAREAAAGWYPAKEGFALLFDWWERVMDVPSRRDGRELPSIISFAVAQALADPQRIEEMRQEVRGIDGLTIDELIARSIEEHEARRDEHMHEAIARLMHLSDTLPEPEPLIEGLVDLDALTILYARWGTYKSFLALDWALSVALGTDWYEFAIPERRNVLVMGYEAPRSLMRRAQAWTRYHGAEIGQRSFVVDPKPPKLMRWDEIREYVGLLDKLDVGLVVVDTIGRGASGADLNSEQADVMIEGLKLLHGPTRAVVAVGHAGKDAGRGLRGSGTQEDAADTLYRLDRERDKSLGIPKGPATLTNPKQKDRDTVSPMRFGLGGIGHHALAEHERVLLRIGESEQERATWEDEGDNSPLSLAKRAVIRHLLSYPASEEWRSAAELTERCKRSGQDGRRTGIARADVRDAIEALVYAEDIERREDGALRATLDLRFSAGQET